MIVRATGFAAHERRVEIHNREAVPQQGWLRRIDVSRLDGLFCFVEMLRGIDGNWFKELMIAIVII